MGLKQKHQFHHNTVYRRSHRAGMALDEVFLKGDEIFRRYMAVAERAETGGHSIYGHRVLIRLCIEEVTAMLYLFYRLIRKGELGAILEDAFYQVVGKQRASYRIFFHFFHIQCITFPFAIVVFTQFMPT